MQTFLPHPNFALSVMCLDWRRLGKQRSEARQIEGAIARVREFHHLPTSVLDAAQWREAAGEFCSFTKEQTGRRPGWTDHSCTVMWRNHPNALAVYGDCAIREWVRRGYNNTMRESGLDIYNPTMPDWLGNDEFHASHRSMLLEKDPEWYEQFGWKERPGAGYVWPE